jgi:hypothetical protein
MADVSCCSNSSICSLILPAVPAAEGMARLPRHAKFRQEREMGETPLHIHPTPCLLALALTLALSLMV